MPVDMKERYHADFMHTTLPRNRKAEFFRLADRLLQDIGWICGGGQYRADNVLNNNFFRVYDIGESIGYIGIEPKDSLDLWRPAVKKRGRQPKKDYFDDIDAFTAYVRETLAEMLNSGKKDDVVNFMEMAINTILPRTTGVLFTGSVFGPDIDNVGKHIMDAKQAIEGDSLYKELNLTNDAYYSNICVKEFRLVN